MSTLTRDAAGSSIGTRVLTVASRYQNAFAKFKIQGRNRVKKILALLRACNQVTHAANAVRKIRKGLRRSSEATQSGLLEANPTTKFVSARFWSGSGRFLVMIPDRDCPIILAPPQ